MLPLLLAACAPSTDDSPDGEEVVAEDTGPVDVRVEPPEPPEGGFQLVTPEYTVPPHSDKMFCFFGTYEGPDVGVNFYQWFQDDQYGHHMMLLDAYDGQEPVPDGTVIDCSGASPMALRPLLEANELLGEISGRMVLEDGLAVRLQSGQRWAMQSHYVNPSDRALLVRDAINIGVVPTEEVEHWVGTWSFNTSVFELPPQEATTLSFSCPWPSDVSVLHMMGHMHDYGTAIRVTHDRAHGEGEGHGEGHDEEEHHDEEDSVEVYSLPEWDPAWQQQPRLVAYEAGELMPRAGDTFTITCDFLNTSDDTVTFPTEMCVAAGLAWPLDEPLHCDAGYP